MPIEAQRVDSETRSGTSQASELTFQLCFHDITSDGHLLGARRLDVQHKRRCKQEEADVGAEKGWHRCPAQFVVDPSRTKHLLQTYRSKSLMIRPFQRPGHLLLPFCVTRARKSLLRVLPPSG